MTCPAGSEVQHQLFLFINIAEQLHAVPNKEYFHCSMSDTFVPVNKGMIFN